MQLLLQILSDQARFLLIFAIFIAIFAFASWSVYAIKNHGVKKWVIASVKLTVIPLIYIPYKLEKAILKY